MGDRANIFVVDQDPDSTGAVRGIYLYTHWNGMELPGMLRDALDSPIARRRWNDPPYLLRILVHQLFAEDRASDTGSGISTFRTSGEYPTLILDTWNQVVGFSAEGGETDTANWKYPMPFGVFTALDEPVWPTTLDGEYPQDLRPDVEVAGQ